MQALPKFYQLSSSASLRPFDKQLKSEEERIKRPDTGFAPFCDQMRIITWAAAEPNARELDLGTSKPERSHPVVDFGNAHLYPPPSASYLAGGIHNFLWTKIDDAKAFPLAQVNARPDRPY